MDLLTFSWVDSCGSTGQIGAESAAGEHGHADERFGAVESVGAFGEPGRASCCPVPMALGFAVGALILSLIGSIPPALRAARLNIVEALAVT